jgi:hypothetical protein
VAQASIIMHFSTKIWCYYLLCLVTVLFRLQFYVAQMLELGQGTVCSVPRAIRWYSLAAAAGHEASGFARAPQPRHSSVHPANVALIFTISENLVPECR